MNALEAQLGSWQAVQGVRIMLFSKNVTRVLSLASIICSAGLCQNTVYQPTTGMPLQPYTVGGGGVTANTLVQFDGNGNVVAANGDYEGIAMSTALAGGSAQVAASPGSVWGCVFENATAVGHIAIPGQTTKNNCRDSGQTSESLIAAGTKIIGVIETAAATGGTASVRLYGVGVYGPSGSAGSSASIPATTSLLAGSGTAGQSQAATQATVVNAIGNAGAISCVGHSCVLRDVVSAVDLGCVGDSSTDNSGCLASVGSSTKSVFFPAGTFNFSMPFTVSHAIEIVGQGNGVTTLAYTGSSSTPAITWNPASSLNYGMGLRDIGLTGTSPNGLLIGGSNLATGFKCSSCRISGFTTAGVSFGSNTWNTLFENSELFNTPVVFPGGLSNSGEEMVFRSTTFAYGTGYASSCVSIQGAAQLIFDGDSFDACQVAISSSSAFVTFNKSHFESPNATSTMPYVVQSSGITEIDNPSFFVQSFSGISSVITVSGGMLNVIDGNINVGTGTLPEWIAASGGTVTLIGNVYLGNVTSSAVNTGSATIKASDTSATKTGSVPLAPTISAGSGAGRSPTIAMVTSPEATDLSGYFTVLTGTSPVASQTIVSIDFARPFATRAVPNCFAWPANPATQALTGTAAAQMFPANTTHTGVKLTQGAVPLASLTAYEWGFRCER